MFSRWLQYAHGLKGFWNVDHFGEGIAVGEVQVQWILNARLTNG